MTTPGARCSSGRPPTDFVQRFARQGPHHSGSVEASQLVVSGVFDRFPKLEIYWAENNVGWLPYFYEQIDHEYSINCFWAERQLGLPRLKRLPSEYLKDHAHWGFFEDHIGVKLRSRRRPDDVVHGFSPRRDALAKCGKDDNVKGSAARGFASFFKNELQSR